MQRMAEFFFLFPWTVPLVVVVVLGIFLMICVGLCIKFFSN